MFRSIGFIIVSCLLACPVLAQFPPKNISHVIYITLDGTRWQDVFLDQRHMPLFWKKYATKGKFYGRPGDHTTIKVASIPVSLPSYQSQMTGRVQVCTGNDCGRVQTETLPERLMHHRGFTIKDVAIFSSWTLIENAAEHKPKTVYVNAGNEPVYDPLSHHADSVMTVLNQQQAVSHPEKGDRYDKYTFTQAWHYFKKYRPKFMWIALQDTDEAAHSGDKKKYDKAFAYYDEVLTTLFSTLQLWHLQQDTLVIVTTDHGRGNGKNWTTHGPDYPESKRTWAFVMNGELRAIAGSHGQKTYSTLSIRPTIEAAFKLTNKNG